MDVRFACGHLQYGNFYTITNSVNDGSEPIFTDLCMSLLEHNDGIMMGMLWHQVTVSGMSQIVYRRLAKQESGQWHQFSPDWSAFK
jgi:hypothetical protein